MAAAAGAALRTGWDGTAGGAAAAVTPGAVACGAVDVDCDGWAALPGAGCDGIAPAPPLAGLAPPGKLPPPERWAMPAGAESGNTCASKIGAACEGGVATGTAGWA